LDRNERSVLRHRGKSPRQAAYFFRNPELNFQSAQLASLYVMCGSFEHAWFLLFALARRDEITLTRCGECGCPRLIDLLAAPRPLCRAMQPRPGLHLRPVHDA
jgi:hypothetical protein